MCVNIKMIPFRNDIYIAQNIIRLTTIIQISRHVTSVLCVRVLSPITHH